MGTGRVVLYVGAPGSGKSSAARAAIAGRTDAVIVERDAIRALHGYPPVGNTDQERHVTKVQNGQIEAALLDGMEVHIANTNTNKGIRKSLIRQLHKYGADVEVKIVHPPLDVVLAQNAQRGDAAVPEKVVRKMWNSLESQRNDIAESYPVQRFSDYVHGDRPNAVVVDIDGTVANSVGVRSPYDYTRVHLDNPHNDVVETVRAMGTLYPIIFVSGREDECRELTESWLDKHVTEDYTLYMRATGDERGDYIIKSEIYDEHIIPNYNVLAVFDDRDSVVGHLRSRGITVMQVRPGRF